jgi:hypothetical protein
MVSDHISARMTKRQQWTGVTLVQERPNTQQRPRITLVQQRPT